MRNALTGVERALFWTLAFSAFAAAAAGLAARAVDRIAVHYEAQRNAYAIVRVVAPEGPPGVAAAETALAHAPHVTSAAPMTAGRAASLLQEWGPRSPRRGHPTAQPDRNRTGADRPGRGYLGRHCRRSRPRRRHR